MEESLFKLVILCVIGFVLSTSEPNAFEPVIYSTQTNSRGVPLFQGTIREDETTVRLEPQLRAYDNDTVGSARLICRYEIVSARKNIPFVIELKNRETGAAELKVKEGIQLNFEKRKHYKFNIFAYDCVDPPYEKKSGRAVVTVQVEDTDHFAPVFDTQSYFVDMHEGKMYERLIQVQARDDDTSPDMKQICAYDIETPDVPFVIDKEGYLKNTEPVLYSERHNFILKVTARDCGGMRSNPTFININIKEACKNGWKGFPEHIEYMPGSGLKKIAENAHLQICDDQCNPDHISVRLQLATKHIGKGCDRDTYGILSQRKLCGAAEESVDLLPAPTLTSNWTNAIPTDDGHEGDKIYAFDGHSNAVVVPDGHVDHTMRKHFTISTWMKHTFATNMVSNHKNGNKENILCMSDGEGMNRHHYAWFIHGSKLIFVLRRESESANDLEVFKPAEWRWNLKAINDGQWHHYALSMDFPEVRLYIDGKVVETDEDNFEVLDDWPLHPTDRVHFTKLVVGACWKGLEEEFADYFQGYLAGLSLLQDRTESERVIQCLNNCQENLEYQAIKEMPTDTSVSFSKDMTEFSIVGKKAADVEKVVRDVAYVNYRTFPTPGRRNYYVRTSVHCGDIEEILPLVESYVFVEHSNKPVITLSGHEIVTGSKAQFQSGLAIFKDMGIHVDFFLPGGDDKDDSKDDDDEENNNTSDVHQTNNPFKLKNAALIDEADVKPDSQMQETVLLDLCTIRAEPVLNFYVEHLDMPKDLIKQFSMKLEGIETAAGLVILNADKIENYMKVLQNIHYTHTEADKLYMRKFVISCSSQSSRFVSNEFEITIAPVEDEPPTVLRANIQNNAAHQQAFQPQFQQTMQHAMPTTNFGMVAIIVVCVGFLMFMIVLGVLRIRAAHHRRRLVQMDEKQEMEWDNSELNITVNPIDQELFEYEENPKKGSLHDDSDTDDDVSECFHDDDESSEEEEEVERNIKTLEWDDSTLSY